MVSRYISTCLDLILSSCKESLKQTHRLSQEAKSFVETRLTMILLSTFSPIIIDYPCVCLRQQSDQ